MPELTRYAGAWLETFLHVNDLAPAEAAHVAGVEPARFRRWLFDLEPLPQEAEQKLRAWSEAGGPLAVVERRA